MPNAQIDAQRGQRKESSGGAAISRTATTSTG